MNTTFDKKLKPKNKIDKYNFIITGANGWLGKALLEYLYDCFCDELNEHIIAFSQSTSKITLQNGYEVFTKNYDLDLSKYLNKQYIVCHFAFLTKDKTFVMSESEFIKQNLDIRNKVENIIRIIKPKALFYTSSGASYREDDLYGRLKSEDEIFFKFLSKELDYDLIIPRVFNVAGPHINKHNAYALSDFINQSIHNNQIKINADFPVIRSYIHLLDLFNICFSWIFDEDKTEKYIKFDTANEDILELSDLAEIIKNNINPETKIIRKRLASDKPANRYVGNNEMQNSLCEKYQIKLMDHKSIVMDTYNFLKKIK